MKNTLLYFILLLGIITHINAQDEGVLFEDYTYVTNIKSVAFHPAGQPLDPPIIYLRNSQRLSLSFDDLDNEVKDFTYEIVHCDKDWNPSNLEQLEYADGFSNEEIQNSAFSVNTFVPYINYRLNLPNRDLTWLLSGNYLLVVYEGEDEFDRIPVISRRFMVVDKKINISVNKRRPLEVLKIDTHHEFDLFVNNKDFKIVNPQNSIYVTVLQNYRWNTGINNLQPKFVVGDQMTIDNTGKVSFPAYKEFRPVDIRSLDYISANINSIDLNAYGTTVVMDPAAPRRDSYYTTQPDANGQFVIQNKDQGDDATWGDYSKVIFTLITPKLEKDVYVMGAFTEWQNDEMYRMRYNESYEAYIGEVLLKQGFYDYFFGVETEDGIIDARPIEGSWADTENLYQVLVYIREPGDRYDRLIGFSTFNSNR